MIIGASVMVGMTVLIYVKRGFGKKAGQAAGDNVGGGTEDYPTHDDFWAVRKKRPKLKAWDNDNIPF